MKHHLNKLLIITLMGLSLSCSVVADEPLAGALTGGLLGAAIGGAAGGGRGAGIGAAVGLGTGLIAGSAARDSRRRGYYYDEPYYYDEYGEPIYYNEYDEPIYDQEIVEDETYPYQGRRYLSSRRNRIARRHGRRHHEEK